MTPPITGCAGFAGSHLAEYLLGKGEEVIGLRAPDDDCANLQHIKERLHIVGADLRETGRVREVIESLKPQRIYHLAAVSSPAESFEDPERTYHVNFMGTLNLLSAWLRAGMDVRFLLVSSAEVYGIVPKGSCRCGKKWNLAPSILTREAKRPRRSWRCSSSEATGFPSSSSGLLITPAPASPPIVCLNLCPAGGGDRIGFAPAHGRGRKSRFRARLH